MLELSLDSKKPQLARDWMRKNPEYITSVVQAAVQLDETTTPEWLKSAIASMSGTTRAQPPRWLPLEELPPIRVGEVGLNPEQITALLATLKASTLYTPHPLVTAVKVNAQQSSLDAFACKLFERWQQDAIPICFERAAEHLKAAAKVRGLSMEELEDRIVPDCGLDAQGTKTFDFGSRQFQFALGLEMNNLILILIIKGTIGNQDQLIYILTNAQIEAQDENSQYMTILSNMVNQMNRH